MRDAPQHVVQTDHYEQDQEEAQRDHRPDREDRTRAGQTLLVQAVVTVDDI